MTQHEAAAAAAHAIHRALLGDALEAATVAAFVLDDDERCVAANETACRLCGWTHQELAATPIGSFEPRLRELHGGHAQGTARIERRDGGRAAVHYRASTTRIGAVPYVLVICWPA